MGLIEALAVYAALLTVLVTAVAVIMTFNAWAQGQVAKESTSQAKESVSQIRDEVQRLKAEYKLASLKAPDEIVADARKEYDPLFERLRIQIERSNQDAEKESRETRDLIDTKLRETEDRIRSETAEIVFRSVLNAFLEVRALSNEERKAISSALSGTSSQPKMNQFQGDGLNAEG